MGTAHDRRRQKKLEKQKKKRNVARQRASGPAPMGMKSVIRAAHTAPFGPAWISVALDDVDPPALVTVLVTRELGKGLLLPELVLVDRTCLGLKNAFVMNPATKSELAATVRELSADDPLQSCEPSIAQAVVFHALDYARSLGFEPHRDFEPAVFEPRPDELADTPLACPARPNFIPGPDDNVVRTLRQLDASVGPYGYDFAVAADGSADWELDREQGEDDEDDAVIPGQLVEAGEWTAVGDSDSASATDAEPASDEESATETPAAAITRR